MHPICPSCGSTHIETLNLGKKTGSAVGFIGGAASGASSAMAGAQPATVLYQAMLDALETQEQLV